MGDAPAKKILFMLGSLILFALQNWKILSPITGEAKDVLTLKFCIVSTIKLLLANAGLRGFISGMIEVTPNAGLNREKMGGSKGRLLLHIFENHFSND